MITKTIDRQKCSSCMMCVQICTNSRVIAKDADGYPEFINDMACIYCGHCFAVCPKHAISFEFSGGGASEENTAEGINANGADEANASGPDVDGEDTQEIAAGGKVTALGRANDEGLQVTVVPGRATDYYPNGMPDADTIANFLFSARSDRIYSDKPVEKEKVEKVVEAMMRAASAGNEQNKHYYVFTDEAKIADIEKMVREYYHRLLQKYNSPLARRMAALSVSMSAKSKDTPFKTLYKQNLDIISNSSFFDNSDVSYLKGAKVLILMTYVGKSGMHKSFYNGDIRIAGTYGILMAKALGLASCWMGLLEIAMSKDKKIGGFMKIGDKEKVGGALILGYSPTKWISYPPRGPAKIIWQ